MQRLLAVWAARSPGRDRSGKNARWIVGLLCMGLLGQALAGDLRPEQLEDIVQQRLRVGPVAPTETSDGASAPASRNPPPPVPPPGAFHHADGGPGQQVTGAGGRRRRDTPKSLPDGAVDARPRTPDPTRWRRLRFSGGDFEPDPGLDPRLLQARTRLPMGRDHTYGFLLLDEYPTPPLRAELEAYGLTILGEHGDALQVRIPLQGSVMRQVGALPYVYWLGYSQPGQKLDGTLQGLLNDAGGADSPAQLPVMINLFTADNGEFRAALLAAGALLGRYHEGLMAYEAVLDRNTLERVIELDFVLFVEAPNPGVGAHDQSMPMVGVDYIRDVYDGSGVPLGVLDSGFMVGTAAATDHQDLVSKWACGRNFTTDTAGVYNDEESHGTHVIGTILGTGAADARYRGVAPGAGSTANNRLRLGKILNSNNQYLDAAWMIDGIDYMTEASGCSGESLRPKVVNISAGFFSNNLPGTDAQSRALDAATWAHDVLYVMAAGNSGSGAGTVWGPGVAKNALTVGNVRDTGYQTVGDLWTSSSRGPTGDGRMKPNLVAPGRIVTSTAAGTANGYSDKTGTSMAAPHVTGIVASLMEHYPEFQDRPYLTRAHLMASSILHNDDTTPADNDGGGRNLYGLGRISSYKAHWARINVNGWTIHRRWGSVDSDSWLQYDLVVPSGVDRLVVVGTWDEPAASAGASQATRYDLDLWYDAFADCTPDNIGQCGQAASQSDVDNTEYLIIDSPPAGTHRFKMIPWDAPITIPTAIAVVVIRGDPTPNMSLSAGASDTTPSVGQSVTVTTSMSNPAYIASGVHLARTSFPSGLVLEGVSTTREDGVVMDFGTASNLTVGNIIQGDTRSVRWTFRPTSEGSKTLSFRAWSENGGTRTASVILSVGSPDLVVDTPTLSSSSVSVGASLGIQTVVRNQGTGASASTTLTYYRSSNDVISSFDTELGTDFVGSLPGNGGSSVESIGTAISNTAGTYWIGACVDTVPDESDTNNNCSAGRRIQVLSLPDEILRDDFE